MRRQKYKPTRIEKQRVLTEVLKYFNWKGTHMLFPTRNGFARIKAENVAKIIEFIR